MTQAQSAAAILYRSGIPTQPVTPPTSLGRGSCAHGLRLRESYLAQACTLLRKTSIPVLGVYDLLEDGRWREVVW